MKNRNLNKLNWKAVSHNPEIKKKVILENGEIPRITTFGKAVFKPGQSVEEHKHPTMYEVFLITCGKAKLFVSGEEMIVTKDDCVVVEPNEIHSQSNPYNKDVVWIYFGVATNE
ncbi:cupin domain-containing protein [Patescibacteria group bacterium]